MSVISKIFEKFLELKESIKGELESSFAHTTELLTYDESLTFFIKGKSLPENSSAVKGIMGRFLQDDKWLIYQAFWDSDDKPTSERYLIATKLNDELIDAFDGKDLLIIK